MTTDSPITPPPELVRQWMERTEYDEHTWFYESYIAEQAARWGADQELEACCEWLQDGFGDIGDFPEKLRAARRPKPPSLAEQALELVDRIEKAESVWNMRELDTIRRALERLQELEKGDE